MAAIHLGDLLSSDADSMELLDLALGNPYWTITSVSCLSIEERSMGSVCNSVSLSLCEHAKLPWSLDNDRGLLAEMVSSWMVVDLASRLAPVLLLSLTCYGIDSSMTRLRICRDRGGSPRCKAPQPLGRRSTSAMGVIALRLFKQRPNGQRPVEEPVGLSEDKWQSVIQGAALLPACFSRCSGESRWLSRRGMHPSRSLAHGSPSSCHPMWGFDPRSIGRSSIPAASELDRLRVSGR